MEVSDLINLQRNLDEIKFNLKGILIMLKKDDYDKLL